ncbi:MAG: adenylate/guanylate cyclase domain-containing protein [Gammaproteobacteria bacterium]|nr:adenylate/guanylate cyclase domain-containing protein [Gammaproteobacteria bacterium]
MFKSSLVRHLISFALLLVLLAHASGSLNIPLLENLDRQAYDFRLNSSLKHDKDPRIVIVDIDDKSLQNIGHWPWGRNVLADMLDSLFDHYQVSVVGFDVLFAEKDESSGLKTLEKMANNELKNNKEYLASFNKIKPSLEYDQLFANALKNRNVVMGYFFTHGNNQKGLTIGQLPDPAILLDDSLSGIPFPEATGAGGNLELFQSNAIHGGFISLPAVDEDGVIRSIPMVQRYGDVLYEALSLAMVRTLMDFPYLNLVVEGNEQKQGVNLGLESIEFEGFKIPVDEHSAALVPYRGTSGSFPYVSAVDIINRTAPLDVMQGSIILVGTTAAGLLDLRSTPVQALYPGVEVHANLIAGILDGNIKHNPAYISGAAMLSLILIWILMGIATIKQNMLIYTAITSVLIISVFGGVYYAWHEAHLVLPIASQLFLIGLLIVLEITFSYFVENRSKRQLAKVFGQYIPRELVNELGNDDDDYAIGGELREMTVMFSDIRGFTAISENMEPKELTQMMNAYFTCMTDAIQVQRGTIDKYIGDAIMAFWGAPIHDQKHPEHALKATLEMVARLDNLAIEFEKKGWPKISIGAGINSGPMYVGNIGSEFRKSYTVLGDSVNLGSRVEALTKKYGVSIIVTESTHDACPGYYYRELDRVRVVGKNEPVTIYQPISKREDIDKSTLDELNTYHLALKTYRLQEFEKAADIFKNLNKTNSLFIYDEYIDRCMYYKFNPPSTDWDGVFTHESK